MRGLGSTSAQRQWFATVCSGLWSGVSMALMIAFNSIIISSLQEEQDPRLRITFEQASWIPSCWAFAGIVGCVLGGWLSDIFGRKKIIILSALPFAASCVMMGCSTSVTMVVLSRAMAGLGDGLMYPTVLVYIAETSSKELRSTMGNFVNISFNSGLIITYLLSMMVTWRVLTWLTIIPPILTILMMLLLPETPYWLAEKNRSEEAMEALAWLRNNEESQDEVDEIKEKANSEKNEKIFEKIFSKLSILKTKMFWKPFLLAEPLVILYNCSGLSIISFYIVTIFQESGSSVNKLQASLIVSVWRLIMSLISSIALLKIPRRSLYLSTTLMILFSMAGLGSFIFFQSHEEYSKYTENLGWVPLALVLLMFAGSQLGYAPITKLIMSEVFPTEVRSTGTSILFLSSMVCLAVLSKLFSQLVTSLGLYGTFWFFSGILCICFIFGYFAMPEHSNVSLGQIEKDFKK